MSQKDVNLISIWTILLVGLPAFFPYTGVKMTLQIIVTLAIGFTLPPKLTLVPTVVNWLIYLMISPFFQVGGLGASLTTGLFGFNSAYILASYAVSKYLAARQKANQWKFIKAIIIGAGLSIFIGMTYGLIFL